MVGAGRFSGAIALFMAALAVSEEMPPVRPGLGETSIGIPVLIKDLGSENYSRREAATRELDRIGEAAGPALDEAVRSADPEVRRRAAELQERNGWASPELRRRVDRLAATLETTRDALAGARAFEELRGCGKPGVKALKALFPESPAPGQVSLSTRFEKWVAFLDEKRESVEMVVWPEKAFPTRSSARTVLPKGESLRFTVAMTAPERPGTCRAVAGFLKDVEDWGDEDLSAFGVKPESQKSAVSSEVPVSIQ